MRDKLKDLPPGKRVHVDRNIFAYKTKAGKIVYGIKYKVRGQRFMETVGTRISLARDALEIRKAEIVQGKFKIPTRRRTPPFTDFADTYLEHAKKHKRSWKRDRGALKPMRAFFSPKRLDQITTWDIERYRARRLETVSQATANRDLALLKHLFNMAISWGLAERNPALTVKLYREPEHAMRVLSLDEERKLHRQAAPHLKPILVLATNTGMRRGELLALEWEQIDLSQQIITVKRSKSGTVRHIPMNELVYETLRAMPGTRQGRVFRYEGNPIESVTRSFNAAVRRAKIPRCRFHDLRHTFATRLVLAGVDLATVQELMGHASIITTRRYAHPAPANKRAAVGRLQFSVYGGATKVQHGEPEPVE